MGGTSKQALILLASIVLTSGTGCSYMMMSSPPEDPVPPSCKTSNWPMVIDAVFATSKASSLLVATTVDNEQVQNRMAISAVAGLALYSTSIMYGVSRRNACREATQSFYERHQRDSRTGRSAAGHSPARSSSQHEKAEPEEDDTVEEELTATTENCATGSTCLDTEGCLSGEVCDTTNHECMEIDCLKAVVDNRALAVAEHTVIVAATSLFDIETKPAEPDLEDTDSDPPATDTGSSVMTVAESAELLDVSEEIIEQWIADGTLQAVEVDGEYRISKSALEETWRELGGGELFQE